MKNPQQKRVVKALLDRHGVTFAREAGINLGKESPAALFQWLCAAILFSARISGDIAVEAARALRKAGWTTPKKMAASRWEDRAATLNRAGYARYDERTATMLGDTAQALLDNYRGNVREVRNAAGRDPAQERKLLKQFKGLGDTGVDIFFREIQNLWTEIAPFADRKALQAARKLRLPGNAKELSRLVPRRELPRLLAALVRCDLRNDHKTVLEAA